MSEKNSPDFSNVEKKLVDSLSMNFSKMLIVSTKSVAETFEKEFGLDHQRTSELTIKILENLSDKIGRSLTTSTNTVSVTVKAEGQMCTFVLRRGDRIGQECGKKATRGSVYCASHKKKMEEEGKSTGSSEGIVFEPFSNSEGTFIIKDSDLLVIRSDLTKALSIGNCEVVGYAMNGVVKELDEQHRRIAITSGFSVSTALDD
ncbi:hypothetical protein EC988_000004 [Linderina pennispora]|nr:hypothetical protein EC988_000004 [Linderina pennispora]